MVQKLYEIDAVTRASKFRPTAAGAVKRRESRGKTLFPSSSLLSLSLSLFCFSFAAAPESVIFKLIDKRVDVRTREVCSSRDIFPASHRWYQGCGVSLASANTRLSLSLDGRRRPLDKSRASSRRRCQSSRIRPHVEKLRVTPVRRTTIIGTYTYDVTLERCDNR